MTGTRQWILQLNQRAIFVAWMVLCMGVLVGTQLCSTIWAFSNPMPHHWDNAIYLNQAYSDQWSYRNGGPISHHAGISGVCDSILNSDPWIPPAYRILSAPFVFTGIRMLAMLRAISLAVFWLSLYLTYRTGAAVLPGPSGKVAGITAAMLLGLYSEIGWSVRVYGTEHTLYLATALLLFCIALATRSQVESHRTWIWLGVALGLGLLSKVSFVFIAGPAIGMVVILMILGRMPGLAWWKLLASMLIALAMTWPYYHLHLVEALRYGQDMTQFQRHSLHKTGLRLLLSWLQLHTSEGMGRPAAVILGTMIVLALLGGIMRLRSLRLFARRLRRGEDSISVAEFQTLPSAPAAGSEGTSVGVMILTGLVTGLPLLAFQLLFSKSDNVRHMTPAYFPITLAITMAAAWLGGLVSWYAWTVLLVCAFCSISQLRDEYIPMTNQPDDIWDWDPIYAIAQQRQIRFPMIGHVGNAGLFCDPAITYPWVRRGRWANSQWLWRMEDGLYDPLSIHRKLVDHDMVLTAPDFHMPASGSMLADPVEQDNAHNAEFAAAMSHEPGWELAGKFSIGAINRGEIWVFVKKK